MKKVMKLIAIIAVVAMVAALATTAAYAEDKTPNSVDEGQFRFWFESYDAETDTSTLFIGFNTAIDVESGMLNVREDQGIDLPGILITFGAGMSYGAARDFVAGDNYPDMVVQNPEGKHVVAMGAWNPVRKATEGDIWVEVPVKGLGDVTINGEFVLNDEATDITVTVSNVFESETVPSEDPTTPDETTPTPTEDPTDLPSSGIALAIIPTLVAAGAAIVVSKKRK